MQPSAKPIQANSLTAPRVMNSFRESVPLQAVPSAVPQIADDLCLDSELPMESLCQLQTRI
jgi:hypothetical protein